jgi:hypothetical protein
LRNRRHIFRSNNRGRKTTKAFLRLAMKLLHALAPLRDRFLVHRFAFAKAAPTAKSKTLNRNSLSQQVLFASP